MCLIKLREGDKISKQEGQFKADDFDEITDVLSPLNRRILFINFYYYQRLHVLIFTNCSVILLVEFDILKTKKKCFFNFFSKSFLFVV